MKLSAPIFRLKRQAKLIAKEKQIPLHEALDLVAKNEGFQRWSQLSAQHADIKTAKEILDQLDDGDLVLLGARRGHGKTTLAFELIAERVKEGRRCAYFTLDESDCQIRERARKIGIPSDSLTDLFAFDTSDDISATYISDAMMDSEAGSLIVIDYLQLLDQQRRKPALCEQVAKLKNLAISINAVIVVISQIDRTYDATTKSVPGVSDVRLPNPIDLNLFTKTCFLHDGEIKLDRAA